MTKRNRPFLDPAYPVSSEMREAIEAGWMRFRAPGHTRAMFARALIPLCLALLRTFHRIVERRVVRYD